MIHSTTPTFFCSSHKGHKFNLLSNEADQIKSHLSNCLGIINTFSDDVTTHYVTRLNTCMQLIEGTDAIRGTALAARQQVHDYFEDLRHNLRRQEEVALSVVNTFVREKKLALQQNMQSLTLILSKLASVESDLRRQATLNDIDLIARR